jgi:Na+/phosphate symporter
MAASVNAFCAQIQDLTPAEPQATLVDLFSNDEIITRSESWQKASAKISADFDALETAVSDQYKVALANDLAERRKTSIAAVQQFRLQTDANLTYTAEKTELQRKQIDTLDAQLKPLIEEAVQAVRANDDEKARHALARKISLESEKARYENESIARLRLGGILKEIIGECDK